MSVSPSLAYSPETYLISVWHTHLRHIFNECHPQFDVGEEVNIFEPGDDFAHSQK